MSEAHCLIKTGQSDKPSYILDIHLSSENETFWLNQQRQIQKIIDREMESAGVWNLIHFKKTPEEIFNHLMTSLDQSGRNPHIVYKENLHSSLSTTQLYTQVDSGQLAQVYRSAHPRAKGNG